MAPGFVPDVEQIVARARLTKVTRVIEGGATRNETTERAIAASARGWPRARTATSCSTTRCARCCRSA